MRNQNDVTTIRSIRVVFAVITVLPIRKRTKLLTTHVPSSLLHVISDEFCSKGVKN